MEEKERYQNDTRDRVNINTNREIEYTGGKYFGYLCISLPFTFAFIIYLFCS